MRDYLLFPQLHNFQYSAAYVTDPPWKAALRRKLLKIVHQDWSVTLCKLLTELETSSSIPKDVFLASYAHGMKDAAW